MILTLVPLFVILQVSRCSVVMDSFSQKGIYLSDYCPQMEYCPEGAHVMCMYYDPNREMGPRCSNPQNVSITPALANQLLDITNAIRSKIANGRETGYNGTLLPRGYGIFRLKWDNELATFAQVLANQCVLKHDLCRATKKFHDPGQTAGLVRFSFPDWNPVSRMSSNPPPGLDDSKLAFSVTQTLKSWYMKKADVTEDMIMRYPTFTSTQNTGGKLYLEIIHGSATHMGCGMSAYSEFAFYHSKRSMNYNSIQVICNFSSRPKPGEMTYSVLPSRGSSTCGCPEGSQEDSDCLCNEVTSQPRQRVTFEAGIQTEAESCPNPDNNCEPTLVLLPIFTIEDAPPDKLLDQVEDIREPLTGYIADRLNNRSNTMQGPSALEINDFFDEAAKQRTFQPRSMQKSNGRQPYPAIPHSLSPVYPINTALIAPQTNHISHNSPADPKTRQVSVPRRSYPYSRSEPGQRRISQPPRKPATHVAVSKKSSIFNRVAKFQLPTGGKNFGQYESIKPDVKPRKDFKNIQRVVNNYIKQRNNKFRRNEIVTSKHQDNLKKVTFSTTLKVEENTETILNNVEERVINFDNFRQKYNVSVDDITKHFDLNYEESDNKLMTLLDTLEREVKHIELDGNEKEIFDAKIRKIYDTVVRKPATSYPPIPNSNSLPKSKVKSLPMTSNIYENDFGESKTFIKHESNHITEDEHRIRHEPDHLSEENRNAYKQELEKMVNRDRDYEYLDRKFAEKLDKTHLIHKEDKHSDIYDNKSFNDDMLTDTDHKLFADIESKYNERLAAALANRRFNDGVDRGKYDVVGSHKYSNAPSSKNRYNVVKYENPKPRATSDEGRNRRAFEKYRDKESMGKESIHNDLNRKYFRNGEDDRKRSTSSDRKDVKGNPWGNEFDQNDPLSAERRKYYQEKLENLERRLHDHSFRRKNYEDRPNDRALRRLRPNVEQSDRQKPKTQGDAFYMPDRARFLHGF